MSSRLTAWRVGQIACQVGQLRVKLVNCVSSWSNCMSITRNANTKVNLNLILQIFSRCRKSKKCYRKGIGVLKENRLGNIKKELKIKGLVKGNRRARLLGDTTTSV